MDWVAWFGRFKEVPGWAVLIGLVNLVGIAYGFYYYLPQFAATPWYLWIFVPDSPLAVLWAELALILWWVRRHVGVLDALAFIGNVQVGLWTVYVLLAYADNFGTYRLNLNTILLFAHAGMALLALIYVHGLRKERRVRAGPARLAIVLGTLYYLVNDALDYFGPTFRVAPGRGPAHECLDYGLRPYTVPCRDAAEPVLAGVTITLTLLAAAALWWLTIPRSSDDASAGVRQTDGAAGIKLGRE